MSMYRFICECGAMFDEPKAVQESRGEFWGVPCSETMYYCPVCGDECFREMTAHDREMFEDAKREKLDADIFMYGEECGGEYDEDEEVEE